MGFFSFNCKACGHSLLSEGAIQKENEWMNECVAITENDDVMFGDYDGYGNIDEYSYSDDGEAEMYHLACWKLSGSPKKFTESSEDARDQGWFFDDDIHNVPEPQNKEDLQKIKI